jgi:hypothetical protein
MPQKKREKKTNKKSRKKTKSQNPNKQNIVIQSIPNYSSGQFSGHQNNKSVAFAPPVQQESRTDNLVGDLVNGQIKCSPRAMESRCFFIIWPSERFQR